MKVNWKHVCKTPGYMSLKAAYISSVQHDNARRHKRFGRTGNGQKRGYAATFRWAIARATHYAEHFGLTLDTVLNDWEDKRTCSWNNYYQDCRQPRLVTKGTRKKAGLKGTIKYIKGNLPSRTAYEKAFLTERIKYAIEAHLKQSARRTGAKARWPARRKEYEKHL